MSFEPPADLDPAIRAILPEYIRIRLREHQAMLAALEAGDLDAVARAGHRIKGTGTAYGLPELTGLGAALNEAARAGDDPACRELAGKIGDLLAQAAVALGVEPHEEG